MSKKNQAEENPKAYPFCAHPELRPSPTGKHLMCPKCGRIILLRRPLNRWQRGEA